MSSSFGPGAAESCNEVGTGQPSTEKEMARSYFYIKPTTVVLLYLTLFLSGKNYFPVLNNLNSLEVLRAFVVTSTQNH